MSKVCANCESTQGPFKSIQIFFDTTYICKNTKLDNNRVTNCVEKRAKSDTDKYKELLHPYA